MVKFWRKSKKEQPKEETIDLSTFENLESIDNIGNIEEDEEYIPEKNIQLLEYLLNLKKLGKASEVIVRMRSRKDIDIIVVVADEQSKLTKILMETDFYIKRTELKVDIVNRRRDKILVLTTDKATYEIGVMEQSEFDKVYTKNKQ